MATTRREFLRAGAVTALGVGLTGPLEALAAAPRRQARGASARNPVVVAVNLSGGDDTLNTVVPLAQYDRYRAFRSTLAWPRERLIPLPGYETLFGLNPSLRPLAELFRTGRVALINGVGCPPDAQGLFDHEASEQNVLTATTYGTAPPVQPTGWLGRFADGIEADELPAAVNFSTVPLLLTGARSQPLSLGALSGLGVYPSEDSAARLTAYRQLQNLGEPHGVQAHHTRLRRQLLELGGTLQGIADAYEVAPGVTYPSTDMGNALRDCAALIAADRGVRVLAVGMGSFDTHAAQNGGPLEGPGYHEVLWTTVVEAIAAFHADLTHHGVADRVLILTISEFGRRCIENNDLGTDHGFAFTQFAIGNPVRGGVYGDYPDLRDEYLVFDGNLDVHIDFRAVYATVLAQHLGVDPAPILGAGFDQLPFL